MTRKEWLSYGRTLDRAATRGAEIDGRMEARARDYRGATSHVLRFESDTLHDHYDEESGPNDPRDFERDVLARLAVPATQDRDREAPEPTEARDDRPWLTIGQRED